MFGEFDFHAVEGAREWLALLNEYRVPCCCCSQLDRESVVKALTASGLAEFFQDVVTADDECETTEQKILLASVKLRRPPERCVVFEDDPRGVASAHDATAKAIALVGKHGGGELRHADIRISGLEDLSMMTLRQVFQDVAVR